MTALARAVAKDCDAPPVLVILPPFEGQRIGNTLLDAGFLPLLLTDPVQGLEYVTAFEGRISGVILGGQYPGFGVEEFYTVLTAAYPDIPLVVVHPDHDPTNPPILAHLYRPVSAQAVLRDLLQVLDSAKCVKGIVSVNYPLTQTHSP